MSEPTMREVLDRCTRTAEFTAGIPGRYKEGMSDAVADMRPIYDRLCVLVERYEKLGAFCEQKSYEPLHNTVLTAGTVAIQAAKDFAAILGIEQEGK